MCTPASLVLTKVRVFFSKTNNSHEDVIDEHGLTQDGVRGPNIVRVEVVPPNHDYSVPVQDWNFNVDQDILPDWWDAVDGERRTRAAMSDWMTYHCCSQGHGRTNEHLVGGFRVSQHSGKSSTQKAGDQSTQKAGDQSTQKADDWSTQKAGHSSTQTAGDRSTQMAGYSSTQKADDWSTQTAGSWSTQTAGNLSFMRVGVLSTQTTRWYNNGKWNVAVRTIDKETADKWYYVKDGVWRLATDEEVQVCEEKMGCKAQNS
jgi:hypothetical protein